MNSKDWYKMLVEQRAKTMAWDDLDEDDRRVYLAEAEKALHKEQRDFAKELVESAKKTMQQEGYISRATDFIYLEKQPKTPKKKPKNKSK